MTESYNIFDITFSEFLNYNGIIYFRFTGISIGIDIIPEYVSGDCDFTLLDNQTWHWQINMTKDKLKSFYNGTINIADSSMATAEFLWNATLNKPQKAICTVTLSASSVEDNLSGILTAVGKSEELDNNSTELLSSALRRFINPKLYLYFRGH
jgi:hypothetical protein